MSVFVVFSFFLLISYKIPKSTKVGILKGCIIDEKTGEPISTTIFIKSKGQVWLAESNEQGIFAIQLPAQKAYTCEIRLPPYQFYLKSIYHKDMTALSVFLMKK